MNASGNAGREAEASLPFARFVALLSRICGGISAIVIVIILAITVVAVVFRYVLNHPLLGIDEGTGFLVVGVVMFGAAEALRRGDHIGIDIVTNAASPGQRRVLEIFGNAVVLVFSVLLLVTAWHTVTFSYGFDAYSTGALEMPLWIPQSTMVAGAVLMILVAAVRLLESTLGKHPA